MNRNIFKMSIFAISFLIVTGSFIGTVFASGSDTTPDPCVFWGTVEMQDGTSAPAGTIVTAYNSSGVLIGQGVVNNDYYSVATKGVVEGDPTTFYVNGYLATTTGNSEWESKNLKRVDLRATEVQIPEFSLIMVPFMLSLMIYGMGRRRIGL